MTLNVVHRPIPEEHEQLVVLSARMRLYAALGSKGTSWHVIQAATLDDPQVGDGRIRAGDLRCCCVAAQFGRTCWALRLAAAFERGHLPDPSWVLEPAGASA